MAETLGYSIGAKVQGTDGVLGYLARIIVDPSNETVTHLVIEPEHRNTIGRLVPVALASVRDGHIAITLTAREFAALEEAEQTETILSGEQPLVYGENQALEHIYHELEVGGASYHLGVPGPTYISIDRVPVGEVEVRRGDHVFATDGPIGHVRGLLVNVADHHVTHILLDEGHLWGHKEVAIPIGSVTRVADGGARLSISKREIEDLPAVPVHRSPQKEEQ